MGTAYRYANIRMALAWLCDPETNPKLYKKEIKELWRACDPDTIRALLAERDAAVSIVVELCSTREGMTTLAGLVCRKMDQVGEIIDAAIAAANWGGDG